MTSTSITRYPSITNPKGLTKQDLACFPSLFATAPSPKMSDRYTFISTADIIAPLLEKGYVCTHVAQRATRYGHRDPRYTRHCVRLRALKEKPVVGDVYPEVSITNSHDGQSRYQMHGGILRLACLNGMTTSTLQFKGLSIFHRGELASITASIEEGLQQAKGALEYVVRMSEKILSPASQRSFAKRAASLVWDTVDFDTSGLLAARREDDAGDDLWHVFNRVQENVIRGGLEIQHQAGSGRPAKTRGITHIRRNIDFNLGLWQMAMRQVA